MMIQLFKKILKKTPIYLFLLKLKLKKKKKSIISNWVEKGKPIPPPHLIKQETVKKYAHKFSTDILIETGTYLGEMVFAMKDVFSQIYSIELDSDLYMKAKERFANASNIHIIQGDSSKVLPDLLTSIKQPCLFWLDGHYSGGITAKSDLDTPILEELKHIFAHTVIDHVILIDDARFFTGQEDYPTIEYLREFVAKERPNWVFEVREDIIRIHNTIMKTDTIKNNKIMFKSRFFSKLLLKVGNLCYYISKRLYKPPLSPQEKRVIPWFEIQGDKTLRLDYDLNEKSLVFDLGGYEGQWTSDIFSKYCCFIHIFEPVEEFSKNIEKRFYKNEKIIVHSYGLSNKNEMVKITLDKTSSSIFKSGKETSDVLLLRAIDFMKQNNIQSIDLMKINIEGGEYDLLEHFIETGFINNIKNIQVQFHDFVTTTEQRMLKIQKNLEKTHFLTYQYPFVWENWRKK